MKISPSRSIQITAAIGLIAVAALVYAGTFEPVITTQPQSQSVKEGESVTFSVTAGNSMNITVPLSSSVSLDMNWCPAGTFNMGSPTGELGKGADESQHQVMLTSGFWMGKYEVTQAQYKAVMGMNPSSYKDESNPLPVDSVSWRDATNFCARLTANEKAAGRLPKGYEYTLPSEAQWEYACRAGTTTALNSGKDLTSTSECSEMDEAGWYKANGANKTHPVGQKLPNAWGLYDMHGNVYEWCWDWYKADYPTDEVVDPAGPGLPVGSSKSRVYRGGSWNENAQNCRSASRGHDEPSHGGPQCGFRVVLTKSRNITIPLTDKLNLEMIWINPDTFTMGSPTGELGRKDNETQHQVTLTWEYWVGKYEVTQAQYEAVMGSKPDAFDGSKHGTGDDFPIYYVSRDEALEFCKQLTEREKAAGRLPAGYEYSLPTEAQWEYACRAGTTKALNNDHDLTSTTSCSSMDQVGWYKHNSGNNVHPTHGAREPNAWGIYDMHGNVWEWVLDWYGDYPTSAVIDPTGAATGSESSDRILRGGAMNQDAENCRSAMRSWHSSSASDDSGFRVALVVVSPENVDPKTRDTGYPTPDNLSYQWYKDGEKPTPVGTDAASYTIKSVEESDAGSYYVVVDNGLGSTISDKAVLTVIEKSLAYSYNTETHTATVVGIGEKAGTTEVVIPETVKYEGTVYTVTGIGNGAFMGDENLINATIPNSVTSIGSNAFKECSGLTGIIIHAGVTSIGEGAFETCSSLTAVYFEGNAPKTGENVFTDTPAVIYYEPGTTGWTDPWCDKQTVMIADSRPKILKQPESQTVVEDESVTFSVTAENSNYLIVPLGSGVTMEMVWVDPGTFNMGSPEDELGRFKDEAQHEVTLTHGFWIGRYEVTQAQYDAQMGSNRSKFKGADLPVEHVSWYDATNFCARLTAHEKSAGRLPEGYSYTLPTEAQWEYACRAGTKTALNSGKDLSNVNECSEMDEVGWYQYNSNNTTHQVGQKLPNAWGLYDMHGNVREWCWDWYENDYPLTVPVDPVGPGVGEYRVLRGGDWDKTAQNCRSAYRTYSNPSVEDWDDVGFRVVLSYTPNITVPLAEGVDLEMIRIAHGNFEMGSPRDELGRYDNETQHKVTLTRDYWLGKLEVTQAQYQAVMGTNPSEFPGANLPVETVSWNDAMDFCAQLTVIEKAAGRLPSGYEYTLPTEAQWEYACRAETKTALNSGKNLTSKDECPNMDEVGWYGYNSGNTTHPGEQQKSNRWGLYDMHGNVFEWCLDWYGDYPSSAVVDPTGPDTGTYRVIRGGSWSNNAGDCRSAYRSYNAIGSWNKGGFRVALVLVSPNDIAPVLEPDTPSTIMSLNYQWYKDGTPISGEKASSYTITSVKGSDEGSYKVTVSNPFGRTESNDAKLTVVPSITIITQPASQIVTYGDKTEMKVEATAAGTITYQWYQNDAAIGGANEAVYTLDKTLLTDAGEYYVVLTSGNTAVPSDKATLTVNKASLTVTAPTLTGVVYGSPKPELTADLDGVVPGDTVTATVNTTYTQGSGVGTYPTTIAEVTGAENYIVTKVPGSLTVVGKPLTVTAPTLTDVVYGSVKPELTADLDGVVPGDTVTATVNTTYTQGSGVGTYPTTIAQVTGAENYIVTEVPGSLTVIAKALTVTAPTLTDVVYGSPKPELTADLDGVVIGDRVTATVDTTYTQGSGVGTYPTTIAQVTGAENYAVTEVPGSLTVVGKPLTVTLENASVVYGQDAVLPEAQITGLYGDDKVNYLVTTDYAVGKPVGDYTITATLNGDYPNYDTKSTVTSTLTVTPASLTVTLDNASVVYGQDAVLPEAQITGLYGTDTVNYEVTTDYKVGDPVGDYTITATLNGIYPNYVAPTPVTSTLTVTPAALTVKADDKTVIYGKEAPAYTVTCSGFQCKDNESSLNGTLAFDCVYTTTTKVGTYPITPKGWSSPNYKITYVDGTLTVIKADQTITFLPVGIVALEPVPLVAFADSGLEVSFTTDKPEMIAIEGNTATALLDGIATITAVQAGDENHNPASVDQIVTTVYKQYPIILWTVDPMPYGTPLGPEQQTAIAVDPAGETLKGEFEYDPAEGTVLEPGKQVLFVTFTPADLSRYYKVSGRTEVEVSKGDMVITWDPVKITYGTALGEEHFDLIATVDGKRIEGKVENQSPAIGAVVPVGSELLLSATFVPMDTTYEAQNASTSLTVTPAEPIVTIGNPEDPEEAITVVYGDTVTDEVTGARAVWFVGEEEVEVEGDFTYLVYGTDTESETMLDEETILPVGEYLLTAVFATEDSNYVEKTVSNEVTLIVEPAVPTVIVEDAGFEFGTVITDEDLSAMAAGILEEPVDGAFEFFVAGVPLNELAQPLAVRAYPLTARFISADPNYTDAESEENAWLTVTQSDMGVVIWQPKTKITYGETIALDAVATVNDVVIASGDELSYTVKYEGEVYPLEEGMILNAGEYEVMAEYVAPLGGGYADARTEWIGVTVFQAVPVLTWTPAAMNYGEAPTPAQMNAEADVEGTFEYPEMSGLDAGEYSMTAIFIPEDSNYAINTVEAVLVVNPIAPVITWAAPAPITDDTALSDAQLNATANVDGTFVYAPKAGTVLEAGIYTLTTVFTPTSKNYTQAAVSVELVVEPSVEVELTWETPAPIEYGTPLSEAQLNAKANVEGDFYYNPAFGTVLDGGVHKLSVIFKPANKKYKNQYKEVELVVKGGEEPKIISYKVDLEAGTMTIEFTCKLYESEDGKNWTLVEGAKDICTVSLKQSKTKFYCAGK